MYNYNIIYRCLEVSPFFLLSPPLALVPYSSLFFFVFISAYFVSLYVCAHVWKSRDNLQVVGPLL